MYDYDNPAYKAWTLLGPKIIASKPKGIVIVSAHWENPAGTADVIVNSDSTNPLIYDFYGFPKHYYSEQFKTHGTPSLLQDVKQVVGHAGIGVKEEKRGLDHGVWVPLKVAFEGETDIPLIQVSLPGDDNPASAAKLGIALSGLRDKGYCIIGTGQVVHNLQDWRSGKSGTYGPIFVDATAKALSSPNPLESTISLFHHPLFRSAHPTPEHFLPLPVAVGATATEDKLEQIYLNADDALGWGMWRWN